MAAPAAAVVAFWLSWASAASGLPIPPGAPLPSVTLGDHIGAHPIGLREAWVGATDVRSGSIVLHPGWRGGNPDDDCLLAHESTHTLQALNRVPRECGESWEPAAYRVTALCYRAMGDKRLERWALREAGRHACR